MEIRNQKQNMFSLLLAATERTLVGPFIEPSQLNESDNNFEHFMTN